MRRHYSRGNTSELIHDPLSLTTLNVKLIVIVKVVELLTWYLEREFGCCDFGKVFEEGWVRSNIVFCRQVDGCLVGSCGN